MTTVTPARRPAASRPRIAKPNRRTGSVPRSAPVSDPDAFFATASPEDIAAENLCREEMARIREQAAGARLRALFIAECELRGLPVPEGAASGPIRDLTPGTEESFRQEMPAISQQASLLNPPA
jgi:hypothetical protein